MKVSIVLLAFIGLGCAAPQPRKPFHEHFEDFMDIIIQDSGSIIDQLFDQYAENEEFRNTLEYMRTNTFRDIVYEMETLPEFKAVTDFLENDNIDILYFIDMLNQYIQEISIDRRTRQQSRGNDLSSFVNDIIGLFPKEKLAALYDQKMAEDDGFRVAIENLQSDEWDRVFTALWDSEVFQAEVANLTANGIDIHILLNEIMAIFGQ